MRSKRKRTVRQEIEELAENSIVTKALSRYLEQVLEVAHEERNKAAADMRERAAKWLYDEIDMLNPKNERQRAYVDGLRRALEGIRALPINGGDGE